MAKKLLPDDLWAEIKPLIPPARPRPKGGRPPVEPRQALLGVLFVLYTSIPWEHLPFEVAGCSGMTCWRRLRDWRVSGGGPPTKGDPSQSFRTSALRRFGAAVGADVGLSAYLCPFYVPQPNVGLLVSLLAFYPWAAR